MLDKFYIPLIFFLNILNSKLPMESQGMFLKCLQWNGSDEQNYEEVGCKCLNQSQTLFPSL